MAQVQVIRDSSEYKVCGFLDHTIFYHLVERAISYEDNSSYVCSSSGHGSPYIASLFLRQMPNTIAYPLSLDALHRSCKIRGPQLTQFLPLSRGA